MKTVMFMVATMLLVLGAMLTEELPDLRNAFAIISCIFVGVVFTPILVKLFKNNL